MQSELGAITDRNGSVLLRMWNVSVPPGVREFRRHNHLYFEITLVRSGTGVYSVGEKKYSLQQGDIFIFASNEQHCIIEVGDGGLEITNLHFEPRFLWGSSNDSLTDENINLCFSHNKKFENRISAEHSEPLRLLFSSLQEELIKKSPEYALSVKSYLNFILIHLIRCFDYAGGDAGLSRQKLHSIRRVVTYIDLHFSEPLSLEVLSSIAGMSPNYLSATFHRVSEITLWEYINLKRIDLATKLIMEENAQNILAIAVQCGFNNTANFNKTFKKITGMTPTEYRALGGTVIG